MTTVTKITVQQSLMRQSLGGIDGMGGGLDSLGLIEEFEEDLYMPELTYTFMILDARGNSVYVCVSGICF
jgi:hypothetical protein